MPLEEILRAQRSRKTADWQNLRVLFDRIKTMKPIVESGPTVIL